MWAIVIGCACSLPCDSFALDILVNQVGFEPNAPKFFRVQRASDFAGNGSFSLRRSSDDAQVLSGTLVRKGGLWNKWYWQADFSAYRIPGAYYLSAVVDAETGTSYHFTIGDHVLINDTGTLAVQYFWTQRCGVAVPGWHGLCHMDDGIRNDNMQHTDAVGGWHDAGDYNKFPHGFAGNGLCDLLWLYDSNRSYYDAIDSDADGLADIVDEALHQARWLVKMVEPSGHIMKETQKRRSGSSFVRPESDTDNIIGTSDDRWINPGDEAMPQEIVCCAGLVRMHRVLASLGRPTENFRDKARAIWDHRVALAIAEGGHNNLGAAAMQVWAGLDLYAELGLQDCYDRALQCIDGIAQWTISNPAVFDSINYAEFGYELGVLAWFARNYPATYPANNARTAVQLLMAHYLDLADDPIGLIRRDESGTLQYFPTNPDWNGFFLGLNRCYLLLTWAAVEAYKTIGDPAYLRFAYDQYNWVMGANYYRVCMVHGAGDYNPPSYHHRYYKIPGHEDGSQPGVVPNGYVRRYETGLPEFDLTGNRPARYQTNEGWLINNAAYAMALSAMTVFDDDAQYVSDTIPSTMETGGSYTVSVTMRNTSHMSWSGSSYPLGAVNDSDPFAAGRQYITNGVTVSPGQSYTWTFNMTAPSAAGTYVTDWRMVQEYVHWFGQTLTRQVQVVPPTPPGPVRSLYAIPGTRQITLSWVNPSDTSFVGTIIRYSTTGHPVGPGDGELLVDKAGRPDVLDTWVHTDLVGGTAYFYSVFAHDDTPLYSSAVHASATPFVASDFDKDHDVDLSDFALFQLCFNGPNRPISSGCANADFDADGDADLSDFAVFQGCFNGPNRPASCT